MSNCRDFRIWHWLFYIYTVSVSWVSTSVKKSLSSLTPVNNHAIKQRRWWSYLFCTQASKTIYIFVVVDLGAWKLHLQQNLINLPDVTLSDPPISNSLIDRIDSILSWPLISLSSCLLSEIWPISLRTKTPHRSTCGLPSPFKGPFQGAGMKRNTLWVVEMMCFEI